MRPLCPLLCALLLVPGLLPPGTSFAAGAGVEPPGIGFAAEAQADKLDINTATAAQLKSLPGMGPAYAERIIRGRPYRAKNQLTQKGILPDAAYARIKDRIVAKQPSR